MYEGLINAGAAREIARVVLPQNLMTSFYATANLRNWAHFIKLRSDEHAQYEVRVVSDTIKVELEKLFPVSLNALLKNGGNEATKIDSTPTKDINTI